MSANKQLAFNRWKSLNYSIGGTFVQTFTDGYLIDGSKLVHAFTGKVIASGLPIISAYETKTYRLWVIEETGQIFYIPNASSNVVELNTGLTYTPPAGYYSPYVIDIRRDGIYYSSGMSAAPNTAQLIRRNWAGMVDILHTAPGSIVYYRYRQFRGFYWLKYGIVSPFVITPISINGSSVKMPQYLIKTDSLIGSAFFGIDISTNIQTYLFRNGNGQFNANGILTSPYSTFCGLYVDGRGIYDIITNLKSDFGTAPNLLTVRYAGIYNGIPYLLLTDINHAGFTEVYLPKDPSGYNPCWFFFYLRNNGISTINHHRPISTRGEFIT